MNATSSPIEFVNRLRSLKRPVLFSHRKPDGDALGALVGLQHLLAGLGIQASPYLYEPLPPRLALIPQFGDIPIWKGDPTLTSGCDGLVILDTCANTQLEPIAGLLSSTALPKLVIDHHQTRDEIADAYWIDTSASATCLMLFELAQATQWSMSPVAANALFIGIATDTGWFRHSNTDARTHQAAARLHAWGVDVSAIYNRLCLQESVARLRLLGEAMRSLELLSNNQLAVMSLDQLAFTRCGATPADTEDVVNEPLRVADVVVSVLFVEQPDGIVRANFRSKAPIEGLIPDIDVARAANQFGGGGHRRAAGARFTMPLADARTAVIEHVLGLFV